MLKKTIALLCAVLAAVTLFTACSGKDEPAAEDYSAKIAEPSTADTSFFKVPAEAVTIDLAAQDPSNDEVQFLYDDEGKVARMVYYIDDNMISVNYTYTDEGIKVQAYYMSIPVDEKVIKTASAYDPAAGFAAAEGYYVKGFTF